jgi:hypothetical protein
MALVFISHAHGDRLLARGICSLLRDALALNPEDFFLSSEEGRGVGPARNIQDDILAALAAAPALIVLLTPKSALSRWVWLEAGNRLGKVNAANPLLVCPSERFTSLLGPLSHTKSLNLDNEGELVELVAKIGEILGRPPRNHLSYKPALDELAALTRREYSPARVLRGKLLSWTARNAAALVLAPLMLVAGWWYGRLPLQEALEKAYAQAATGQNEQLSALASRYLILNGTVNSQEGDRPIPDAVVMASKDQSVRAESACRPPECTHVKTFSNGEFSIDLTRISAAKEDHITLTVVKPGFETVTNSVRVDVRAMDVRVAPQTVKLAPVVTPGSPQ